jgi:3-oxoacyl-[acyl-carrier protein] reductase
MSSSSRPLDGQVALVTGASRGIGRGRARAPAEAPARWNSVRNRGPPTTVWPRDPSEVETADSLDIADYAATAAMAELVGEKGRLDILINNAGVAIDGLLLRYKEDDWERIVRVNLGGVFHCCKAAVKPMIRARYGRIVNLTSVVSSIGNAGQSAYAATKAGVEGFTRALAREVASRGVTVNAVAPGFIDTEMTAALPEAARALYLAQIPVGRLGAPEEVAAAVAFLADPGSAYVTGHVLAINGGLYT